MAAELSRVAEVARLVAATSAGVRGLGFLEHTLYFEAARSLVIASIRVRGFGLREHTLYSRTGKAGLPGSAEVVMRGSGKSAGASTFRTAVTKD